MNARATNEAFTLIEIMVVIAVVAMLAGGVGLGMGALTNSKTRSDAMKIVSAAKFAHHRAIIYGTTTRVALSFENNTLGIEEADNDIVLGGEDADVESEDGAIDPWAVAASRVAEGGHETQMGRSGFGDITNRDGESLSRYKAKPLKAKLRKLISPHESDERSHGNGYIYFFPNGFAENAIVQLSDKNEEKIYSVIIDSATGKGRIEAFAYEADDLDSDRLEVRDPR